MDILRTCARKRAVIIVAAVIIPALAGCGIWSNQAPVATNQAPVATANVAAAPEATRSPRARARHPQTHASSAPAAPNKANTGTVLSQIHQANLMEIALGKMAEEKSSMSEVRAYADQLVLDHTNVDQTVVAMAQKGGAHLQDGAAANREGRHESAQAKQLESKLRSATGPDFDRLFLQQTSSDHERLIRKLQQEREDASDDDLEALIDKTIPILEQHRELAQILMKKELT
jgi:predicted outer membrane protein